MVSILNGPVSVRGHYKVGLVITFELTFLTSEPFLSISVVPSGWLWVTGHLCLLFGGGLLPLPLVSCLDGLQQAEDITERLDEKLGKKQTKYTHTRGRTHARTHTHTHAHTHTHTHTHTHAPSLCSAGR